MQQNELARYMGRNIYYYGLIYQWDSNTMILGWNPSGAMDTRLRFFCANVVLSEVMGKSLGEPYRQAHLAQAAALLTYTGWCSLQVSAVTETTLVVLLPPSRQILG